MNLSLFNNLINNEKGKSFIQNFIKELSNYIENTSKKVSSNMNNEEEKYDVENLREEGTLYQVVDRSAEGVFLQNTRNNKVFEEKNISKDLLEKLDNDYILRYENGEYIFKEELTDDFFESLVSIEEYEEIKEKFIKESDIIYNDKDTKYSIISRQKNYSILSKSEDKSYTIEVPNALLPYFADSNTLLKFADGKFSII